MNILLISTLGHNPGDEFIRLGLEHVLRQVFPGATLRPIHKQDPRTLFSGFRLRDKTPHRLISPLLYRWYEFVKGRKEENFLETADLVIFAGSPFIWRSSVKFLPSTCANAEWVHSTWHKLFREVTETPVFNLAAGTSAFTPKQFDEILSDRYITTFLKKTIGRTALVTSRDEKTREILSILGCETELIPCASLLAAKGAYLEPQTPEYVVINLMPAAAPRGRGHGADSAGWFSAISSVIPKIEKTHKVKFVSHFPDEDAIAAKYFPGRERYYSKDPMELLKVYSKAYYGICNRVHSGAAVATFARPVISVGGDYRNNLIKQFGMPAYDHRELNAEKLWSLVEQVEQNYDTYVSRVKERMAYAEQRYLNVLQEKRESVAELEAIPA